jgi:hypothetical protein
MCVRVAFFVFPVFVLLMVAKIGKFFVCARGLGSFFFIFFAGVCGRRSLTMRL